MSDRETTFGVGQVMVLTSLGDCRVSVPVLSCHLAARPAAVGTARGRVRAHFTDHLHRDALADAELIVTELVTNAAGASQEADDIELSVRLTGAELLIEVFDHATETPRRRQGSQSDEDGRGLLLVEKFARLWGWAPIADRKVVWAVLPVESPHGPAYPG
ncbi:ATP-binding protein [Kitasatospora sp. NBC_00374]|uniref:ATP-binding protein n=1 Tax=Kitasatospora sp. NBC_00374 TaxID=2975964 RepID=UPI0030E0C5C3